jgi:transposase-like protein
MKQRKAYKTYTREFKQEAVRLMETTNRPATEVAMELGIRRTQLYEWKEQLAKKEKPHSITHNQDTHPPRITRTHIRHA